MPGLRKVHPLPSAAPDSYRALAQAYTRQLPAGTVLYDQGTAVECFFVVLSGRVTFEVVDAAGERSVVQYADPGDSVGVVSAFTGERTSAAATASEGCIVLAVPISEAANAFRIAPEFAIALLRESSERVRTGRRGPRDVDDGPRDIDDDHHKILTNVVPATAEDVIALPNGNIDLELFFVDRAACSICTTRFEYLRVRASALRPVGRDSDFRISYRTVNPLYYSVIACPSCGYAAYVDDFERVSESERRNLLSMLRGDDTEARENLCGERTPQQAVLALELALDSYTARDAGSRRRAALLHTHAWIERERGESASELRLLQEARDAYRDAYERESGMDAAALMRAAYLIGDLTLRIGDPQTAYTWLSIAIGMDEARRQVALARTVRERMDDARQAMKSSAADSSMPL